TTWPQVNSAARPRRAYLGQSSVARRSGTATRERGPHFHLSPLPSWALVSTHLVPRLRLGTQCQAGSACREGNLALSLRKSRQSLDGSAFPGGAWERESPAKTRYVDTNASWERGRG